MLETCVSGIKVVAVSSTKFCLKPRKDDGKPLEPLTLKYGEAKATITMHGDSIKGVGWFEEKSCDPITNECKAKTTKDDFTLFYSQPAYSTVEPRFT